MSRWPNGTGKLPASATEATPQVDDHPDFADRDSRDSHRGEELGTVKIARRVLRTVIEEAALGVPGVARMAGIRNDWPHLLGRPLPQHGISLAVHDQTVAMDLYLIVQPGASMVEGGAKVQEAVGAAVEHLLGMGVSEINVYIQDVA